MLYPRRESFFYHNGLPCIVLFTTSGHRCGYVGVPSTHPLSNIDYNDDLCLDTESVRLSLLFNVHGGITYSDKSKTYPIAQYEPIWWFGFDCAHCGDDKDFETFKNYYPLKDYIRLREIYNWCSGEVKTKEYVEEECKSLAKQIAFIGQIMEYQKLLSNNEDSI